MNCYLYLPYQVLFQSYFVHLTGTSLQHTFVTIHTNFLGILWSMFYNQCNVHWFEYVFNMENSSHSYTNGCMEANEGLF